MEKILPPSAPPPAQVVVERFGACPPKPSNVIVERWLPYKQPGPRRVLVERAATVDLYVFQLLIDFPIEIFFLDRQENPISSCCMIHLMLKFKNISSMKE